MDCPACAVKIETAVKRLPGIVSVDVSVTTGLLKVTESEPAKAFGAVEQAVSDLGYVIVRNGAPEKSTSAEHGESDHGRNPDADDQIWWLRKLQLVLACGSALAAAFVVSRIWPFVSTPAMLAALAIGLLPIAARALAAARFGSPFTIETLMTIAAAGAVLIGAAEEAAVVVILFLVGELLEGFAAGRARNSIRALTALVPKSARLDTDGTVTEVPADSLRVGSIILVRPGDRIPADGKIIAGEGGIDESPMTGESRPKHKRPGDIVFAGTINLDAALRLTVTAAAADNTIARVVQLVEQAQEAKAPTQRFIDRFSRYYTPAVLVLGLLVAVVPPLIFGASWQEWTYKGLALLLIGCPCALVISTPAAIAAGLSAGARHGLLIKGGAVLEVLGRVTTVALDKTGTLTEGLPKVTDVIGIDHDKLDVIRLAGALETGSSHPLAKAVLGYASEQGIALPAASDSAAIGGKGITGRVGGESLFFGSPTAAAARGADLGPIRDRIAALNADGKTVAVLMIEQEVAGLIALRDEPRADARSGLDELKARQIGAIMLTGDNRQTAEVVGRTLSIEVKAEMLPEDKLAHVENLRRRGEIVAKVGDGINDAPALAAADVGIAMGGGTDVALETGDAAILHGRVLDVAHMIDLSRRTMANIWQNIAVSLGLKAVFLVTTLVGLTGLWPAILADTGATVLVTLNALRLLTWNAPHPINKS
jgi:Cd2+/Zn2+-exporting ATPase